MKMSSPLHLHKCLSGAYTGILAVVLPCTEECRFCPCCSRVDLFWRADLCWFCVATKREVSQRSRDL